MKTFETLCPSCGATRRYNSVNGLNAAIKDKTQCRKCATAMKFNRPVINENLVDEFMSLHVAGYSGGEIGAKYGISPASVERSINGRGRVRKKPCLILVGDNDALCSRCQTVKPLTNFSNDKRPNRKYPRRVFCKQCVTDKRNSVVNDNIMKYMEGKVRHIRAACRNGGKTTDLTAEFLVSMYKDQNSLCFYTETPMEFGLGRGMKRNTISVDRIEFDKGYTKSNVVLCTRRANSIKNDVTLDELRAWLPGWYDRLKAKGRIPRLEIAA